MTFGDYYDRDGRPLDLESWTHLLGDESYKRVALTEVDGVTVSTVWLGLNHGHGYGPPLIFETMVFDAGSWSDRDCQRYSTEDAARRGHEEVVTLVRATTAADADAEDIGSTEPGTTENDRQTPRG